MTERANLRGRGVAYVDRGDRLPLLFIHGFPLDHGLWDPQVAAFAPQRRVVAPDLAGFGTSEAAAHDTLDGYADDLAALLDHLGIARAVVAGLSMGGYIAFALWRRHAARVGALVLACTKATADTEAGRAGRYQTAMAVEKDGMGVLAAAMLPNLLARAAPPDVRAQVEAMMQRQSPAGAAAALRAMAARPDSTPTLATIDVPTLIVAGAEDAIIPTAEAEAMASGVRGARLSLIAGAGHLANLEEPGAFNVALRSFLEGLDAR